MKAFAHDFPSDGAVICPACWRGPWTAGHDEIRDADRLFTFSRSRRSESDGLIGVEDLRLRVIMLGTSPLIPASERRELRMPNSSPSSPAPGTYRP